MTRLQPRQLTHVGRVLAHGFVIEPQITGEAEARRRILALWQPGATVSQWRGSYILQLPKPISVRVDTAPGVPLVLQDGRLCALPLTTDELEQTSAGVVVARDAQAYVLGSAELEPIDPATWVDVSDFVEVRVRSLGVPPPPALPPREPGSPHLRDHVPALPELRSEAKALQDALHGHPGEAWPVPGKPGLWQKLRGFFERLGGHGKHTSDSSPGAPGEASGAGTDFTYRVAGWWQSLTAALGRLFGSHGTEGDSGLASSEPAGPSAFSKWIRGWFAKAALRTRIAHLLGQRQAKYLQELLDMFDEGDLDAALRHAIPLGAGSDEEGTPTFGLPSPRDALSLSMGPIESGGGTLFVGDSVMDILRQRYRRAFERLVQKERIEEAAFVLADLLQETDEAVSFLESHERFKLAAELAESRELLPAKVVRQWVLAGDLQRAMDLAKRHDVFANAIALLENKHPKDAERLRLLWADALAERGEFEAAVDAVWRIKSARRLAETWVALGIGLGGPSAARLLVRALTLLPDRFDDWLEYAETWWADPAPEEAWTRGALAESLIACKPSPQVGLLAKGTLRALCQDAQLGTLRDFKSTKQLVKLTNDGVLKADWPGASKAQPPFLSTDRQMILDVPPGDVGALPIFDAVCLAKGRFLLALGEAGIRVVSGRGQTLVHFDEPAHELVISDQGHRALGLARRGRFRRVTRVDLVNRRATPWCDLKISVFADTFDGWTWFTVDQGALAALDIGAEQAKQLWRNNNCMPQSLSRSPTTLWAHHQPGPDGELWQFELPNCKLRARTPLGSPVSEGEVFWGPANATGQVPFVASLLRMNEADINAGNQHAQTHLGRDLDQDPDDGQTILGTMGVGHNYRHFCGMPAHAKTVALNQIGGHSLLLAREPGSVLRLIDTRSGALRLTLIMADSTQVGTRVQGERVLAFDEQGRLLSIDLHSGSMQRSLRIRA